MRRSLSLALLAWSAFVALAACAGPAVDPEGADRIVDVGKGDFAASATLWQNPRIPVCWESPEPRFEAERGWVEDAVRGTWSAVSAVELTGWGPCVSGAPGIHIGLTDAAPHTLGLGKELDGVDFGMRLNFEFTSWSPGCQETREFCVRAGAVHEVGHAIGFAHEQNRADTPGWCAGERGAFGDLSFSEWDLDSIMNYCNPEWTGNGDLSDADVIAVRALYGRDRGTALVARSDGAGLEPEWVFAEDAALAALGPRRALMLGDVSGDGRADVVAFNPADGAWWVLESTGERFLEGRPFGVWSAGSGTVLLGDMNGDGRDDAIHVDGAGVWSVGLSDGAGFAAPEWVGAFEVAGAPLAADVDGDGRDDAIVVDGGAWWVARSVGTGIAAPERVEGPGRGQAHLAADVSGDGRAELVAVRDGAWWVAAGTGSPVIWAEAHGAAATSRLLADLDGDGRRDALVYERERGRWFARSASGDGFGGDAAVADSFGTSRAEVLPAVRTGDVDGDGDEDVVLLW